jgi:hypothetical protein
MYDTYGDDVVDWLSVVSIFYSDSWSNINYF